MGNDKKAQNSKKLTDADFAKLKDVSELDEQAEFDQAAEAEGEAAPQNGLNRLVLRITAPADLEDNVLHPIEFNFEELKAAIAHTAELYKAIEYSEDTMRIAKKDVATLRKFSSALNQKKIEVKKQCLKPVEDFEKKIKALIELVEEPVCLIDEKVKAYELQLKQAKLEEANEIFTKLKTELALPEWLCFAAVKRDEYENLSCSINKINNDLTASLSQIKADLDSIESMQHEYEFELLEEYKRTLNLASALAKVKEVKEEKARRFAFIAEQEAKRAALAAKSQEEAVRRQAEALVNADNAAAEAEAASSATAADEASSSFMFPSAEERKFSMRFEVTGTEAELKRLAMFLKSEGLDYKKI